MIAAAARLLGEIGGLSSAVFQTGWGVAKIAGGAAGARRVWGLAPMAAGVGIYKFAGSDFVSQTYLGQHGPRGEDQLAAMQGLGRAAGVVVGGFGAYRAFSGRGLPIRQMARWTRKQAWAGAKFATQAPRAIVRHPRAFVAGLQSPWKSRDLGADLAAFRRIGDDVDINIESQRLLHWRRARRIRALPPTDKSAKRVGSLSPADARKYEGLMRAYSAGRTTRTTVKWTTRKARAAGKYFMESPYLLGLAGGMAFGTAYGLASPEPSGREGNIKAINSAPRGGIMPELQFSTQGLVQALHVNSSRISY